jgi:hypothetical protein
MGTDERQSVEDIRAMRDLLKERGFQVTDVEAQKPPGTSAKGPQLLYWEVPGGTHDENSWSKRVDVVLADLLPSSRGIPQE